MQLLEYSIGKHVSLMCIAKPGFIIVGKLFLLRDHTEPQKRYQCWHELPIISIVLSWTGEKVQGSDH